MNIYAYIILWINSALLGRMLAEITPAQKQNTILEQLVENNDCKFETHWVITEDNYILTIHRVLSRNFDAATKVRPAVLLMHGILGSSADWLAIGRNRSLGYLLADNGYDVWLGNNRGSTSSKNHTTLSVESSEYWDFSWHELGMYDAPAIIDYVLNYTGQQQLFYVGYSQGNTQFWVLTSLRPEYNNKIKLMSALAPVAYTGNIRGLPKALTPFTYPAKIVGNIVGYFEVLSHSHLTTNIITFVCVKHKILRPLCKLVLHLIGGFGAKEMDEDFFRALAAFMPAGCSYKQLVQYGRNAQTGRFQLFDYNPTKNQELYNASVPPEYPIHKITAPVILFVGPGDFLGDEKDVKLLKRGLPNMIEEYWVPQPTNHYDFVYGKDIENLVYDPVLQRMNHLRYK